MTGGQGEYLRYKEQNLFRELDIWVKEAKLFPLREYPLGIRAPGKMAETRRHQECFRIFGRT